MSWIMSKYQKCISQRKRYEKSVIFQCLKFDSIIHLYQFKVCLDVIIIKAFSFIGLRCLWTSTTQRKRSISFHCRENHVA